MNGLTILALTSVLAATLFEVGYSYSMANPKRPSMSCAHENVGRYGLTAGSGALAFGKNHICDDGADGDDSVHCWCAAPAVWQNVTWAKPYQNLQRQFVVGDDDVTYKNWSPQYIGYPGYVPGTGCCYGCDLVKAAIDHMADLDGHPADECGTHFSQETCESSIGYWHGRAARKGKCHKGVRGEFRPCKWDATRAAQNRRSCRPGYDDNAKIPGTKLKDLQYTTIWCRDDQFLAEYFPLAEHCVGGDDRLLSEDDDEDDDEPKELTSARMMKEATVGFAMLSAGMLAGVVVLSVAVVHAVKRYREAKQTEAPFSSLSEENA